jgi:hypothetical protein
LSPLPTPPGRPRSPAGGHARGGPGWTHMNEPIRLVHSADRVG